MSKLTGYNGSIELISGITQKNGQDFPLVEAHAVQMKENGERLDEYLANIKMKEQDIVNAVTGSEAWQTALGSISSLETKTTNHDTELQRLDEAIKALTSDEDSEYGVSYDSEKGVLYLYKGQDLILPDEAEGIIGNVISYTPISGGGGGGSSTITTIDRITDAVQTILFGDEGIIQYRLKSSLMNGEENDNQHTIRVYVNDKLCITQTGVFPGEYSVDVTKFLESNKENSIRISATDADTEATASKRWVITTVEITLETKINTANEFSGNAVVRYDITGNVTKSIHVMLNDRQFGNPIVVAGTSSGSIAISHQSHGVYKLEIYATATIEEKEVRTESQFYEIMFKDDGDAAPIIRTNYIGQSIKQYSSFSLEYSVYNPADTEEATVTFAASWDGERYTNIGTVTVMSGQSYLTPSYDLTQFGTFYYKITCGSTVRIFEIEVEDFGVEITQVTAGLAFDLNPVGRSNNSEDRAVYNYTSGSTTYHMTPSEGFDWVNGGWTVDENGDSCLLIKAGDYIDIDYKSLFGALGSGEDEDPKFSGREFKIIYKVSNIYDTNKTFVTCYDESTGIGLRMYPHNAYITSSASESVTPLSEEDIIEFEYNLTSKSSEITMIMPYEDGTPAKPTMYVNGADSFNQRNEQSIRVGSTECDVYLYRLKIYNNELKDEEILKNFIADGKNGTEKATRYTRNQIYDVNNKLTPERLAEACPDLRIIVISAPYFTNDKKDKVKNTTCQMIYKNGDAILDNWIAENCVHNGQGTSSNEYGYAGRNIDISMKEKEVKTTVYNISKEGVYKTIDGGATYNINEVVTKDDPMFIARYPVQDKSTVGTKFYKVTSLVYLQDGTPKIAGTEIATNARIFNSADTESREELAFADYTEAYYTLTETVYNLEGLPLDTSKPVRESTDVYKTDKSKALQAVDDINMVTTSITTIKPGSKITLGDKTTTATKVSLTRESVPANYFNIKVNIASSENANNALLQKRYDRYIPYESLALHNSAEGTRTKNSMEFFNCVVFIQETNEDISTHREFSDTDIHFYAIGNIGDSKKTDSTRAADASDDREFTLEITDWNKFLSSFPMDTMIVAPKDFLTEDNFTEVAFEKVGNQYEKTSDAAMVAEKTYYIDALENEPFDDSWTYDIRYSTGTDASLENIKDVWKRFYRFITRDLTTNGVEDPEKIAAWKEEFKNWFVLDSALYWYLFTLRYTMVDNRAKNSFWHYGKCTDGKYRFDLWDYDNDTALGINNAGKLTMTYGVEDIDSDEGGVAYFRGHDSTFFCRVRDYFKDELIDMYKNKINTACFNSAHLIKEFDEWQAQFPEELWRLDYVRKYKRTYLGGYGAAWDNAVNPSTVGKGASPLFLTDMMNGRKKYQRRQFERDQDFYMASKFMSTTNYNDAIMLRCTNPSGVTPTPNYTIQVTPYMNMYINLYSTTDNCYYHERCQAGQTYTVRYPSQVADFIYIRGASKIQSLGDLSRLYLEQAQLGSAEKLKDLVIGNKASTYANPSLTTLEFKSNPLLEKLDITNTAFASPLDLTMLQHLKELYTEGSHVTGVSFANNGLLEIAKLNDVSSLNMKNLLFIKDFSLQSYDKLALLSYENCRVTTQDIVDDVAGTTKYYDLGLFLITQSLNMNTVRIIGVDWDFAHTWNWNSQIATLERLANMNGISASGGYQSQSVVTGRALVSYLTQSRKTRFNTIWPNLDVTVAQGGNFKEEVSVTFKNEDGTVLYETVCDVDGTVSDPIETGAINTPTKEQDIQFVYTYAGWDKDLRLPIKDNTTITATYSSTLRVYRVQWYGLPGDEAPLARATVQYGGTITYEEAIRGTAAPEIPSRISDGNTYYIFDGWDRTSFYITGNTDIYAKWQSGVYEPEKILADMTTAEIKAMVSGGFVETKLGKASNQNGTNTIDIQLGYMPSFNDVEENIIIANTQNFDGSLTTARNTEHFLLAEDKSWTLAIDFEFLIKNNANSQVPAILAGCYDQTSSNGQGFVLATTGNGQPFVSWGAIAKSVKVGSAAGIKETRHPSTNEVILTEMTSHRDIVVIRHVKGDKNLYVYSNDRYTNSPVKETVLDRLTPHGLLPNIPLSLGAGGYVEKGRPGFTANTGAAGKIHYMKLWNADLGAIECKKIAAWIYNKQTFQYFGSRAYYEGEEGRSMTNASFIAKDLLDEKHIMSTANSHTGGFPKTDLYKWLNEKFYYAFPPQWRQLIVTSRMQYANGYNAGMEFDGTGHDYSTSWSSAKIFIPSAKDIYTDAGTLYGANDDGGPFVFEGANFDGGQNTIAWYTDNASRIKNLGNGDIKYNHDGPGGGDYQNKNNQPIPTPYYIASLAPDSKQNTWYKVWADGSIGKTDDNFGGATGENEFGICPMFSI